MRRWLAVLLGVTLAVLPAASALAATPTIKMDVPPRTTVLAGDGTVVTPAFTAGPGYTKHTMTGVVLTFETTGAGLAKTHLGGPQDGNDWGCAAHGPHKIVCTVPVPLPVSDKPWTGSFSVTVYAGTAPVGGTGDLKVTLDAKGIPEVVKHSQVAIAERVILPTGTTPSGVPGQAAPGTAFDLTVGLDRTDLPGNEPVVHGVALLFGMDYAFEAVGQFSNCYYRDGQVTACLFDRDLPNDGCTRRPCRCASARTPTRGRPSGSRDRNG